MEEWFKIDKIFDVFNVVLLFFILNLLFMLVNIPIIVFLFTLGISQIFNYFPLFLLCLIPLGPAFTILLYCMGQFIKYKSLTLKIDLVKGIKLNTIQSLFIWCIELAIVFMIYSNMMFFASRAHSFLITCISMTLGIVLLAVSPYIYLLISRFSMKTVDIIKTALVLTFTRPLLTITNILILLFMLLLFELSPGTIVLFCSSILAYFIQFVNRPLLTNLEKQSLS